MRIDPVLDGCDADDCLCAGRAGTLDHDDRQAKPARGMDLAKGRGAAAVLADDDFHAVGAHQRFFRLRVKRAAIENDARIRQDNIRRIDTADQIAVLRVAGKRREFLPSNGQKHGFRLSAKRFRRACDIIHFDPAITLGFRPSRALKRDQRRFIDLRRRDSVRADLCGKGMRHIDQKIDIFGAHIGRQPFNPAEAAHPRSDSLRQRRFCAASQRKRDAQIVAHAQTLGQSPRVASSAKDQKVWFAHAVS